MGSFFEDEDDPVALAGRIFVARPARTEKAFGMVSAASMRLRRF
jgi:hypothetical protein